MNDIFDIGYTGLVSRLSLFIYFYTCIYVFIYLCKHEFIYFYVYVYQHKRLNPHIL